MSVDINDLPLAVYTPRPEGQLLIAEIEGAVPASVDPDGPQGCPALVVQFRVPGPMECAQIEARSREAVLNLIQGAGGMGRYGFKEEGGLDEAAMASLSTFIAAVESAVVLIKNWNFAVVGVDGQVTRALVTVETISELFRGRPAARAGWTLQYETASPLERSEGNASAASPNTTSATAANTARDAQRSEAAAAEAASAEPESSAPAP